MVRRNGIITHTNTIILYFVAAHSKEKFHSQYLHKAPLKKEFLDQMKCDKIIIGEHLTKTNALLFTKCLALRKSDQIAQTFTSNGIVLIQFIRGKNEPAHQIRSEKDLLALIEKNKAIIKTNISNSNKEGESVQDISTDEQERVHTNKGSSSRDLSNTIPENTVK